MSTTDGTPALCLAIEVSNPGIHAEVALGAPARPGHEAMVLACEPIRAVGRNEDDLLPAIERARAAAGVAPRAIGLVAVSIGPGGYTSLRVACAAAKMIAEAAGARCVPIPTARVVLHATSLPASAGAHVGVFLAGKDDTAFLTVLTRSGDERTGLGGRLVRAADVPAPLDVAIADEHLPAPIRALLTERRIPIVAPALSARACLDLAPHFGAVDPVDLLPLYPREPDAVTLWRQRQHR